MEIFKRYLKITLYFDVKSKITELEKQNNKKFTKEEIEVIKKHYPPLIINHYPDEYTVNCSITKSFEKVQECIVDVVNLSAYLRFHLLNSKYNKIKIDAGYLGRNWNLGDKIPKEHLTTVFQGSVIWMGTNVEARKNVITRFVAVSGQIEYIKSFSGFMNINFNAGYNLFQMIREIEVNFNNPDIRLNISKEDRDKVINYKTNAGINNLAEVLKNLSIDVTYDFEGDSALDVKTYINLSSGTVDSDIYEVNEKTGLIDLPSLNGERKINFKMIYDPRIQITNFVKLNNYDIKLPLLDDGSANSLKKANSGFYLDKEGIYRVLRINYSLESRGSAFTMSIEAVARDVYKTMTTGKK